MLCHYLCCFFIASRLQESMFSCVANHTCAIFRKVDVETGCITSCSFLLVDCTVTFFFHQHSNFSNSEGKNISLFSRYIKTSGLFTKALCKYDDLQTGLMFSFSEKMLSGSRLCKHIDALICFQCSCHKKKQQCKKKKHTKRLLSGLLKVLFFPTCFTE